MKTRTDALLAAITAELEARRAEIDADAGLCSLGIIVKLDEKTGRPRQLIWRPESQRRVGVGEVRRDRPRATYVADGYTAGGI